MCYSTVYVTSGHRLCFILFTGTTNLLIFHSLDSNIRIRQTLDVKGEAGGEKFTHKLKKKWQGTHRNSASSMQEKEYQHWRQINGKFPLVMWIISVIYISILFILLHFLAFFIFKVFLFSLYLWYTISIWLFTNYDILGRECRYLSQAQQQAINQYPSCTSLGKISYSWEMLWYAWKMAWIPQPPMGCESIL